MPTLIEVPVPSTTSDNSSRSTWKSEDKRDAMESGNNPPNRHAEIRTEVPPVRRDDSETSFDDSATVLSKNLLADETTILYGEPSDCDPDETKLDASGSVLLNSLCGERGNMSISVDHTRDSIDNSKLNNSATIFPDGLSQALRIDHRTSNSSFVKLSRFDRQETSREIGPHEAKYDESYREYVKATIQDFNTRFPNRIRHYGDLSEGAKMQARQHVVDLLARLRIGRAGQNEAEGSCQQQSGEQPHLDRIDQEQIFSPEESPILKTSLEEESLYHAGGASLDQKSFSFTNAENSPASTPSERTARYAKSVNSGFSSSGAEADLSTSKGSVELLRASESVSSTSHICESPEQTRTQSIKRSASRSGKRGADLVRHKTNHDYSFDQFEDHGFESPELKLSTRMERLSLSPASLSGPNDLFVASQSPISPGLANRSADSIDHLEKVGSQISWDDGSANDSRREDSMESLDTSLGYTREPKRHGRHALRELPVNLQLRPGARLHLDKLEVKHARPYKKENHHRRTQDKGRYRLVNFPDPFRRYSGKRRESLETVYDWVNRRHARDGGSQASAVFSLSQNQIAAVTIKLLLDSSRPRAHSRGTSSAGKMHGQTILVVRTKDDIANWESALRDGTGCSVLNHATLPLSERIRKSTAENAAAYEVVLTTYDALKSPDVAIPVNEAGHAIIGNLKSSEGWYSSRSASQQDTRPQACKQFSVLHRIEFERVIFVDVLGRKCFLGKAGTARASAATALSARSRSVFFLKTEIEGMSALSALRKSDRRAIPSVSSVLHLDIYQETEEEEDEEAVFEDFAIDVEEQLR